MPLSNIPALSLPSFSHSRTASFSHSQSLSHIPAHSCLFLTFLPLSNIPALSLPQIIAIQNTSGLSRIHPSKLLISQAVIGRWHFQQVSAFHVWLLFIIIRKMLHSSILYYHTEYHHYSALRFSKLQWIIEQKLSVEVMTSLPVRSIHNLTISSSHQILLLCRTVEENQTIIAEITKTTLFEYIYNVKSPPDPEVVRRTMYIGKTFRFSLLFITAIFFPIGLYTSEI